MSGELAARITAAAAVAADFTRETDAYLDSGATRPDFDSWAWRLLTELRLVLDGLAAERIREIGSQLAREDANGHVTHVNPLPGSHVRIDGVGELAPEDVFTVLSALADGTVYRSQLGDRADAIAYQAVAWRLGDDR